ncbi:serine/threonine-protein kinase SIK2-like isoform X1 [Clavelina lepadiformis]|uniref:serine/threonine-protein kinase SIK2-like isoform X1 n=1 Tax=Clavelina lepadiformis TaxID=159417 RepID=UPI0040433A83
MVMAEPIRRTPIRVGLYDIIRTIGKGNFAVVKLARHRITKSEVAIKIIEKTRLDQSNLMKIYREIQILKLLRHQHIIKLYQVIDTKTTIYLVTEYAAHGEVFDYITQEERLPEEVARKMFYQVLTAIEYCHKNNVVHRDLKAENLLLDQNDNIKLADFGFGNFFQTGQNLNTWCGSPPYAAPEVFEGKLYEGPHLDIWSLGIVLYVLVCGTFPFDGSNLTTLKERVLAGRFRIPYWMSQDCENLIRRMLVVNPKKRLTISQIKKHSWLQDYIKNPEVNMRKCESPVRRSGSHQLPEFNEHILKLMQTSGLDRHKTIESLRNCSYDHLYATYHLLVDRLKHHRTSVPLETKFSFDGGRRRPSNISDQTLSKQAQCSRHLDESRTQQFITTDHTSFNKRDDVTVFDAMSSPDQLTDVTAMQDLPNLSRTLALGTLQFPHIAPHPVSPPPVSKPRPMMHPSRGSLPHQPWSFHAGVKTFGVYSRSPISGKYSGSGDVIPSVRSIDEGAELQLSEEQFDEIRGNAGTQRRHTLGVPEAPNLPLIQASNIADCAVASAKIAPGISDAFSDSLEMNYEVIHHNGTSSDVTPKLVLSPCLDESGTGTSHQDSRCVYMENQRQLLDVSPTGFREGRRASDGLLSFPDNRVGEHLKRLTRTQGFPTINKEDVDEGCFEASEAVPRQGAVQPHPSIEQSASALDPVMSYYAHHVAPHCDAINFQPYASNLRRRSLQVAQYVEGRSSSYTNSAHFAQPIVTRQCQNFQPHSSYMERSDDVYQWSSWKPVTESLNSHRGVHSGGRREIPVPINLTPLAVASDESMTRTSSIEQAKRQPSLPNASGHHLLSPQSLVQQLQQRRLKRRLRVANHNISPGMAYQADLPELAQLKIATEINFGNSFHQAEDLEMFSMQENATEILR